MDRSPALEPVHAGADEFGRALEEAVAYAGGGRIVAARVRRVEVPDAVDMRSLRRRLGLIQADFTGFALAVLRASE